MNNIKKIPVNIKIILIIAVIFSLVITITSTIQHNNIQNKTKSVKSCDKQCQIHRRYEEIAKESIILEKYKTAAWNDGTSFIKNYSGYKKTQREIAQKQNEINIYISKDSTPQGLEVMRNKILGLSEEVTPLQKLSGNDL